MRVTAQPLALRRTYRYLRLGIVLLVLLLAVSVALEYQSTGILLSSLSAYYYTPVHTVFVASLCGAGACLVIYRGVSDVDDVLLNIAGLLAFVVAFVPIRFADPCAPGAVFCPVGQDVILDNLHALLIIGGLTLVLGYVTSVRPVWPREPSAALDQPARRLFWTTVAGYVGLVIAVIMFPSRFLAIGHLTAAGILFACMVVVVARNGLVLNDAQRRPGPDHTALQRVYWTGFVVTTLGGAVLLTFTLWPRLTGSPSPLPNAGLWLESFLLIMFGAFWLIQTFTEVWDPPQADCAETVDDARP